MRTAQSSLVTQNLKTTRVHKTLAQNKADNQMEGLMVTEGHS